MKHNRLYTGKIALRVFAAMVCLASAGCAALTDPTEDRPRSGTIWMLDNLVVIGGHTVTVTGEPEVIETSAGKAIEFDGVDDGIFLDVHPLAGLSKFTVEVIFMPYAGGAPEQRFFHMQEVGDDNRVMFETRLVDDTSWFLDTFIKSDEQRVTLYASNYEHPLGQWHNAAIVVDGQSMRHFVNGQLELTEALNYRAQKSGRTSLGVRLNRVHWFKGAIRQVRITTGVVAPEDFLSAAP